MAKEEKLYLKRIFQKLRQSWDLRREIEAFENYIKNFAWIMIQQLPGDTDELKKGDIGKHLEKELRKPLELNKALSEVLAALRKSAKQRKIIHFEYGRKLKGMCYPLVVDEKIFGFVVLCGLRKKVPETLQAVFSSFTDAVIRETQKELELEELNKTVRPRAIALSTVHTVHRLMGATLDLNELLPRIARLSLQVMRSNRCSIKLVDRTRKVLLPKTTIDLRKKKAKLKKVTIGKYAPGRAVKQARPIRGKNYLATPLIEEEVLGVITLYDKIDGSEFTSFDEEIMKTLAEQAVIAIKNAQLFQEQEDLTLSSIKCIAQLLETRPSGFHKAEGSFLKLLSLIGRKFNMNESEVKMLQYAAMLHDAGQISVPEKVLLKKGYLTGKEYDIVKMHPLKGANILSKFKPLKKIVPIILYHHENYDGSGYPKGLKKDNIPLAARILGIVASFEAMITEKPYRKALSIDSAVKEVRKNSGTQFDPKIVDEFCEAVARKDVRRLLEKELGKK
ncbi:MAG: HD domain-containing phosphohydrolase [Candidatus Omnitrophota bacterium]|jgi:HD-GYP domain-containing protein (c-di-GMP phosphodiesterase class II)